LHKKFIDHGVNKRNPKEYFGEPEGFVKEVEKLKQDEDYTAK